MLTFKLASDKMGAFPHGGFVENETHMRTFYLHKI